MTGKFAKGGYHKSSEKLHHAIFSRFDLIFVMYDRPDPYRDEKLSEHIMRLHSNSRKRLNIVQTDENGNPTEETNIQNPEGTF